MFLLFNIVVFVNFDLFLLCVREIKTRTEDDYLMVCFEVDVSLLSLLTNSFRVSCFTKQPVI